MWSWWAFLKWQNGNWSGRWRAVKERVFWRKAAFSSLLSKYDELIALRHEQIQWLKLLVGKGGR